MKPSISLVNFTPSSTALSSPPSTMVGTVVSWFHRLVHGQRPAPTTTGTMAEAALVLPLSSVARLVMLVGKDNPLPEPMTIESYAAAAHLVEAGHVQVSPEGVGTSVVDAILAARGLRRHIALVLPNSAGIPFIVAATDLIATLPSRIVKGLLPMSNVRILSPPLPEVEVSLHMFWHRRTHTDPLQIWLRAMIREIAADM